MTYQLKFTTTYKKSYKLMKKRGLDITLLDDVYLIENDILTLTLVDTGSHSDIFKK
ncbi:MAG: type II toxin-antitoxin system YafQ family toxin [Clostridium sp.]|nr:type II toxin-antitoxin system YafQ family toxin [Clostridium sp.]